jgi:hypothetical protein
MYIHSLLCMPTQENFSSKPKFNIGNILLLTLVRFSCITFCCSTPIRFSNFCNLKVPKREIFDCSDFPDFYTIKSSWVGDFVVKILTYYFNF